MNGGWAGRRERPGGGSGREEGGAPAALRFAAALKPRGLQMMQPFELNEHVLQPRYDIAWCAEHGARGWGRGSGLGAA